MKWVGYYLKYFRDPAKNAMEIFCRMLGITKSSLIILELSFFLSASPSQVFLPPCISICKFNSADPKRKQ